MDTALVGGAESPSLSVEEVVEMEVEVEEEDLSLQTPAQDA